MDERKVGDIIYGAALVGVFASIVLMAWLIDYAGHNVVPGLQAQLESMGAAGTVLFYIIGAAALFGAISMFIVVPIAILVAADWLYHKITKAPYIDYFTYLYVSMKLDMYLRALGWLLELDRQLKCGENKCCCG